MTKTIVIGAGASGITAAITLKRKGQDVLILEKNKTCLKKLLATGNGRCNYLNDDFNINHFHSDRDNLLKKIIKKEDKKKIINFFDSIGIVPRIKEGYYYPYSNQASSIKNALLKEIEILGIKIEVETEVLKIKKEENKFIVITNHKTYKANHVVLATGSSASKIKGSEGDGYKLLKNLNLKMIKPLPALVQVFAKEKFLSVWHGVRCDASIKLIENNQFIKEEKGEIQLTKKGLSGICIMQLSRYISKGLDLGKKEVLEINFLPIFEEKEKVIQFLEKRNLLVKNRTISDLLEGILNYKLVNVIIKKSKLTPTLKWNELSKKEKENLVKQIIQFTVETIATDCFDQAQVVTGGLSLDEVNVDTLEVKKIKGLYVIGELLDIDGDCGGYNLSNAWLTGMKIGDSIND